MTNGILKNAQRRIRASLGKPKKQSRKGITDTFKDLRKDWNKLSQLQKGQMATFILGLSAQLNPTLSLFLLIQWSFFIISLRIDPKEDAKKELQILKDARARIMIKQKQLGAVI